MLLTYLHKGLNFLGAFLSILIFISMISFTPDPDVVATEVGNDASLSIMLHMLSLAKLRRDSVTLETAAA